MASLDSFGWVGHDLGGAAIKEAVARGGFAVVYRARHKVFGADVAIKCLELKPEIGEEARRRFLRLFVGEARAMYRLTRLTASVVQPLNLGTARAPNGQWAPWLMLEWLEGRSLADKLAERQAAGLGGMPLAEAIALLSPVAEALSFAHAEGIAHRDVTPGNIFVWQRGRMASTKLLDFGIAKFLRGPGARFVVQTSTTAPRLFTRAFAAPEQLSRAYGDTGPATDVYALALVLVACVSAREPYLGAGTVIFEQATDAARRPTLRARGVRAADAVEDVLERALAVDPRSRFDDASSFWKALRTAAR